MPAELSVNADRDQLYRVVSNLTQNAVQALAGRGEGGTVRVSAWREAAETIVEIADSGPGLPEQVSDNPFEAFADGERGEGTGLGLAIARDLVRNHGGDIELERTGADGTVFRLRLPDVHGGEGSGSGA